MYDTKDCNNTPVKYMNKADKANYAQLIAKHDMMMENLKSFVKSLSKRIKHTRTVVLRTENDSLRLRK